MALGRSSSASSISFYLSVLHLYFADKLGLKLMLMVLNSGMLLQYVQQKPYMGPIFLSYIVGNAAESVSTRGNRYELGDSAAQSAM